MDVETKYALLKENIKNYGKIAVAYSGGLDSTFLLKVCHDVLGDNVIAVSIRTDLQPVREYLGSEEFVKKEGIKHFILKFNDYTLPCFKNNPPDRCYYCKKEILLRIINVATNEGITTIVDGSNMDDLCDYRPGRRALTELHIKSPLLEAGMTKKDIRVLSQKLGLYTWNKLSPACMASRFPYGTAITPERIAMLNKAEQVIADLGFTQFRVRLHDEVARIEVINDEINRFFDYDLIQTVVKELKKVGFSYVCLDLEGYRMGSMNNKVSLNDK